MQKRFFGASCRWQMAAALVLAPLAIGATLLVRQRTELPCPEYGTNGWRPGLIDAADHFVEPRWTIDVSNDNREPFLSCLANSGYDVRRWQDTKVIIATRRGQQISNSDPGGWINDALFRAY